MRSLKKGFTLIELIIVITILAVLATVAFITLGDYPVQSRDSKRESDIANIAKKATVITADGTVSYKSLVLKAGTTTNEAATPESFPNPGTAEYKVYYGDINYANLKESADAFKAPLAGEKYKIIVVNDKDDNFICFEVGAEREQTPKGATSKIITRGTCNPGVTDKPILNGKLYSNGKTGDFKAASTTVVPGIGG